MFEIFFALFVGFAIGFIMGRDYEIVLIIVCVLLDIVLLPFRIIYSLFDNIIFSEKTSITKVIRLYDKIFLTNNSKKIRRNYIKRIDKINEKMKKKEMAKIQKEAIKMLNEAKWLL